MNRAIFLDRDGTLNYDSEDYIKNVSEFVIFPFTIDALKILENLGYKLIVITNQSIIARKLASQQDVESVNNFLKNQLSKAGIALDAIYYCPHHPDDNCSCRKPGTGNILKAVEDFNIDLSGSYFIGDSERDIEAGAKAGCKTILVLTGFRPITKEAAMEWSVAPDFVVENILDAAQLIEKFECESDREN